MTEPVSASPDAAGLSCGAASAGADGSGHAARADDPVDSRVRLVLEFMADTDPGALTDGQPGDPELARWYRHFVRAGTDGLRSCPSHGAESLEQLSAQNEELVRQLALARMQANRWAVKAGGVLGPSKTSRRYEETRRCPSRGSAH